jgi:hypothetical protein
MATAYAPVMPSWRRAMHEEADALCQRYEALKQQRAMWDFDWQDIVRLLVPMHDDIIERIDPGQSRTTHIFDSHPLRAPQMLAANIMGSVTNQSREWRKLRFREEQLNESQEVSGWMHACDVRTMAAYSASNFYQAAHTYYVNLGAFGTAAMYEGTRMDSDGQHLCFKTLPTGSYVIAENADGIVDTLKRELWYTPRQAIQLFEGQVSEQMKTKADSPKDQDTPQKFLHCVYPRSDRDSERYDNRNMPFASKYIEFDTKFVCEEGGYEEFPFFVSRWETLSRSPYGYGPGHIALPDVRVLNILRELHLQQLALWVQPPVQALEEGVIGNISLANRAVNIVRQMDAIRPIDLTGRPDLVQIDQADLRRSIDDSFFVHALQALPPPDASNMTAYEVAQRIELMTRLMGPVFYRLLAEFLNPLEDRTFGLMWRAGALPPPPMEVLQAAAQSGGQLDVDYDGPLARAQKGEDVKAMFDLVRLGSAMVEMYGGAAAPGALSVLDNIDWDANFRHAAEVMGIPKANIIDFREVVKVRALKAQQAQAMQQAQIQNESMAAMGRVAPMIQALQDSPMAMVA